MDRGRRTQDGRRTNVRTKNPVVGAIVEDDYVSQLRTAGLEVDIVRQMDYFAGSVSANTRRAAHALGAHAVVMQGRVAGD
jgi:hypothetical protein